MNVDGVKSVRACGGKVLTVEMGRVDVKAHDRACRPKADDAP